MSERQSDEGWWSGSQYQQYWEDLRKVEERLQGREGHTNHLREERVHGVNGHLDYLKDERKKGGSKREAAYWKAVAAGLQFENSQLRGLLESLLGLGGYPRPHLGIMATNINVESSSGPLHSSQRGQNWAHIHDNYRSRRDNQNSSSDEGGSTDSEEDVVEMKGGERKQAEVILRVDSLKEEVDPSEEEYFRFLAVSEKHKKDRDGGEGESLRKKFDFRTDTITDAVLEEGLAMIDTDHERTKREMEKLYGSKAMKVHSAETKAQLRFDDWRDQNSGVLWPALPLKIIR